MLIPRTPLLVEGCAGMAAVTWAAFGMVPPVPYQGGKRGYAGQILAALRVAAPERVMLVEADPWVAAALRTCWDADLRAEAVDRYRDIAGRLEGDAQREVWEAWRQDIQSGALTPDSPGAGAVWLWMRPRTVPFVQPHRASRGDWLPKQQPGSGASRWAHDAPAVALSRLLPDAAVTVVCSSIVDVEPVPGAALYLDPPYAETKGYGADLPRDSVVSVARRWRDAGCVVGISETSAVMDGVVAVPLVRRVVGRNFADTSEVLTLLHPAA